MKLAVAVLLAALCLHAAPSPAAPPVVVFDQGHGQRFPVEKAGDLDLSALGAVFRQAGFTVRSTDGKLTPETLSGVTALVTSGPFVPYDADELRLLLAFLEEGGALSVMLHVASPCAGLLEALGVLASPGVLREGENVLGENPLDFRVKNLVPHPLTEGVAQFGLHGAWAVMDNGKGGRTLAFTSRQSWIDGDRDGQRGPGEPLHVYGVLAVGNRGKGRFAVWGDDAVFQNRFLDDDNRKLAANLARWLEGLRP